MAAGTWLALVAISVVVMQAGGYLWFGRRWFEAMDERAAEAGFLGPSGSPGGGASGRDRRQDRG